MTASFILYHTFNQITNSCAAYAKLHKNALPSSAVCGAKKRRVRDPYLMYYTLSCIDRDFMLMRFYPKARISLSSFSSLLKYSAVLFKQHASTAAEIYLKAILFLAPLTNTSLNSSEWVSPVTFIPFNNE